MRVYAEVMPRDQQELLPRIGPTASMQGFYPGGGTAVAIHLGHRRSLDLDWFTEREIADPMSLAAALRAGGVEIAVESVSEGTLHASSDTVRLSFLQYRYPLLRPIFDWSEFRCSLASLEDLACMKLSALAGRGARKGFINLYALGRSRFSLREMLALYREKYETRDTAHVVYSLTYFDDADREDMPEMLWDLKWPHVKRTIEAWVRDLSRRQAPPVL